MVSAKKARDNFINTYGADFVDDRLLKLWVNDCARKFVSVENTSYAKAKLYDIEYQSVNLDEDFNRVIQVWFAPGELKQDRHDILSEIAEFCGTKETYTDKCTGEKKEKCVVDINSPKDYFADSTLNSLYTLSKTVVGFSDVLNKPQYNNNFIYAKPSIETMDFAKYVIPCNNYTPNKIVYKIEDKRLSINYPEGVALVVYYAFPIDDEGYYMFPDETEFWEAINSYAVYKHGETKYIKNPIPQNERYWKNTEMDYLRKLGLAKDVMREIDIPKFIATYKDITERVLGRHYNDNPLEIK